MQKKNPVLFTVGPVEMDQNILEPGSGHLPYFRTEDFSRINLEISEMMKEFVGTGIDSETLILTSSGTGAMEAIVLNTFNESDKVLIVNGGGFGQRFVDICSLHKIPFEEIKLDYGKTLTEDQLQAYQNQGITGLLTNAHETTTGVYYDLDMIGNFCKKENIIFIVDAISSFLADSFHMDKWNIHATILSSQKGLALPPGLSFLVINKNLKKTIMNSKCIKSFYFNLKNYIKEAKRGQTPFTPAVSIILQLHKRLSEVKEIGLDEVIKRTENLANSFRENIKGLPFDISSDRLSNALTPLSSSRGMSADQIFQILVKDYQIFVNPNGGILKDKIFRVGHMGNLKKQDNDYLVSAFIEMERKGLI